LQQYEKRIEERERKKEEEEEDHLD